MYNVFDHYGYFKRNKTYQENLPLEYDVEFLFHKPLSDSQLIEMRELSQKKSEDLQII